jgi:hypothetical protein
MKKKSSLLVLSLAQERAIGRMTVKFNWMEHSFEVMINLILGGDEVSLAEILIDRMPFGTKVDALKRMVDALPPHYVPTEENEQAYKQFASAVKQQISQARQLNTFRSGIVHWRSFLGGTMPQGQVEATAKAIDKKADEMESVGDEIFSRAIGVRQGDNAFAFGQQFRKDWPGLSRKG